MSRQLVLEPSTLVYTLFDESAISYDDFYLVIRSLHSYMVESINPNPEAKSVQVRLKYQASVENAQAKLGKLQFYCTVSKLSNFVADDELSRLGQLTAMFGIGGGDFEPPKRGRKTFKAPKTVFPTRSAPYKPAAAKKTSTIVHPNQRPRQESSTQRFEFELPPPTQDEAIPTVLLDDASQEDGEQEY